ncbi:unnamed protein product [Caenorhabditis sp. 36 PRJEB53466]|nr:unnamed protein product [Caenorhabditis sp. 36 PRJEB53466]
MYKFYSTYLFVLAFFTVSCTGVALISNYDSSPFHRNVLCVLFDLSFTLLCIVAPYLSVKMSEAWQNELDLILVKVGVRKATKVRSVCDRSKRLKNTFGEVMDFETSKHSDVYFEQLKKSWNKNEFQVGRV